NPKSAIFSGFGGKSQHDVKSGGQFADARPLDRGEIHNHGLTRLGVFDSSEDTVALVLRLAFDVTLCGPLLAALHFEGEMNVPRAARVQHRLDGAEIILAGGACEEAAEPLEILVAPRVIVAARVQVDSVAVHLPDLDQHVADRAAPGVEDAPAEVRDLPDRG